MRVVKDLSIEVPGTNAHYFKLDELATGDGRDVLYYGYNFMESGRAPECGADGGRKIYLNVTMPTEFCSRQPTEADGRFDEVYGICPYTIRWLNGIRGGNKYRDIFYPFNEADIPAPQDKLYDVCYHGGIHGERYSGMLKIMRKFNYRYMTQTHGINKFTKKHLKYATDTNLTNDGKLRLIARCRISICFNTFDIRNDDDVANIKARKNWRDNEAFRHIEDLGIAPQFKSRCNEAAFSRTLNLVKKDPWNVIERYYTPGEDFVYFEDLDELEWKIRDMLDHWDRYRPMIESAYEKSLNYTCRHLYRIIESSQSWQGKP
ncbi:MAG: glycosyltransferase family 1 protein [Deltaproteobacteria bacterium]|nr:glycosyltransferase family 1 protein [Deltaproteobacteria bacterium]